ncbi:hypothetical protein HU200_037604 [Digitaria exilis]|uniref:Cytochrome P450 n=1 Tax=Digitaria exilis TaxID=1010633 RepID=A0A835EMP3_9POAL|nr:hypothetical protein HU200_037604 [Digitaria exilis]
MLLHLGTMPTLVVSSPAAAREVMKAHDVDCCSRPVTPGARRLSYGHKDVAFSPYGEYWREVRKVVVVELLSMRRPSPTLGMVDRATGWPGLMGAGPRHGMIFGGPMGA